jgi:integrase
MHALSSSPCRSADQLDSGRHCDRPGRPDAGVELRLHDLRHFFASGLIAEGCDVVTAQRGLGHTSASTTLNTYSHLWPSAEDRTRAAAGRLLSAAIAGVYPSCTGAASDAT